MSQPQAADGERPLRILLISSELPPETGFGGIGTYVAELAPALAARGHRVTILTRALGEQDKQLEQDGVRVLRLATRPSPPGFWAAPFNPAQAEAAADHYARAFTVGAALAGVPELRAQDVIEAPDWAGEAALARAVLPEVPYVVKFHTPAKLVFQWNQAGPGPGFVEALHALERIAVRNACGFSCPSRWMIEPCERLFELPPGNVAHLPNPFRAVPPPARREGPGRSVLFVGRLEGRKGVLEVAPAMARVLESLPDVRWELAGADTDGAPGGGSMRAELLRRIPAHLHRRVRFLGQLGRAQVAEALSTASAVLLPSRQENFPYTCLEAMAAGAAVVGSVHGGMAEMLEGGRTGLLVDPRDAGQVADALYRVLEQPLFAEALGRGAGAAVRSGYEPRAIAARVERHYRQVIRGMAA